MRPIPSRWVLPISLLSIVPIVVLGILVVQRLVAVNAQRYDQEVVAARYAAEIAADAIRDDLSEHFGPWRESLVYAHGRGEEAFRAKLQKMYLTSPLVGAVQFVDEAAILAGPPRPDGAPCAKVVPLALRTSLIEQGRTRLGSDPEQAGRAQFARDDIEGTASKTPLTWIRIDRRGPLAAATERCADDIGAIAVQDGRGDFDLLSVVFTLPGGDRMQPGLFGAAVPARALLDEVVAPALARWNEGTDALPRHALRLVSADGAVLLRSGPTVDDDRRPLHTSAILGDAAPWRLEVVSTAGFDASRVKAENGRWSFALALAGLLVAAGAVIFGRSFLQQAETARLRRALLGNVGHELKTPLSLIRMYTETLESGRVRTDEERSRFLGIVGREAKRLSHLIDNLLAVQRIEEEREDYAFAQVRPDRIVRETVDAYRYQITEKGFELRLDVDDDLPLLFLDQEALAQALINLLDNAVKYSDTTREIGVRVVKRHDEVRIAVRDRGIGIPIDEQEKIFESFYRVAKTDVHDVKGSGLGLPVVAHVAEAHGGSVEVDSQPGRGSTFTLRLPVGFEPS